MGKHRERGSHHDRSIEKFLQNHLLAKIVIVINSHLTEDGEIIHFLSKSKCESAVFRKVCP